MSDWSQLPLDILLMIYKCISGEIDLLRFRSICSSWRSSCPPRTHALLSSELPGATAHGGAVSYSFSLQIRNVSLVRSDHCDRSWMLKSSTVLNGKTRISCPSADKTLCSFRNRVLDLTEFRVLELGHEYVGVTTIFMDHYFAPLLKERVKRVAVMKVGAESDSFALLAHHFHGDLALFRSGDSDWTVLQNTNRVTDVASFNGKFYAVDGHGKTFSVDQDAKLSVFDHIGSQTSEDGSRFLVESSGELLLVEMDLSQTNPGCGAEGHDRTAVQFRIYKVGHGEEEVNEVKSLGDAVLFLGEVWSFSASASQLGWPRGNFIVYGTILNEVHGDAQLRGRRDREERSVHVHDFEKGEVISHLEDCCVDLNLFSPPPSQWFATS